MHLSWICHPEKTFFTTLETDRRTNEYWTAEQSALSPMKGRWTWDNCIFVRVHWLIGFDDMRSLVCLEANEKFGIFIPKWGLASAQSVEWSVHQLIASVPSPSIKRNLPHMCMIFHIFGAKFISYDYLHHISILYDSNIFPRYQYELCICSSSKKLYHVLKKQQQYSFLNYLSLCSIFYIYVLYYSNIVQYICGFLNYLS